MRFFNQFNLETPESVELEFTLAGIGNRAYALFIDYCVLGLTIFIAYIIFISLIIFSAGLGLSNNWLIAICILLFFAISMGYFVFFETTWQGQSPGKRFVKIRVISENGQTISLTQATLRSLLRPIDDILFVGAIMIIFSKKEKRLGDWLAGTLVIQEEQNQVNQQIDLNPETEDLLKYIEENAEISRLTLEDFVLIRQYLQRREGMLTKAKLDLAREIGYIIKDKIALVEIPENITAIQFLEAIYLAYQKKFSA